MKTLVDRRSELQRIRLCRSDHAGLMLFLDDQNQFAECNEHRYHESLTVVPMLFRPARRVFVGGGGDGLVATRLLKFDTIERVVICDYDTEVTELARTDEDLLRLNERSLLDPRVTIVNHDAVGFLETSDEVFDLAICDFPDAADEILGRLYTDRFYHLVAEHLDDNGVVCVQTTPSRLGRAIVRNTLRTAMEHVHQFHTHYLSGGTRFFTLAAKKPLERALPVPEWTRYLSEDVVASLLAVPRDEPSDTDAINTVNNGLLARELILDEYLDPATAVYPYNRNYRVVFADDHSACAEHDMPFFLRCCTENGPMIVYVARRDNGPGHLPNGSAPGSIDPDYGALLLELGYERRRCYRRMELTFTGQNMRIIETYRQRLTRDPAPTIHAYLCRTSERAELQFLMEEYFSGNHSRYFDAPVDPERLDRERLHLVVRSRKSGRVITLMVIQPEQGILVDILYGRGSSRQNMLGLVTCLRLIERECGPHLVFFAATEGVEGFMNKLGAFAGPKYDVYVPQGTHIDYPAHQSHVDRTTNG